MSPGTATRDDARREMHLYMVRTGIGLRELADRTGYRYHSIRQFSSGAQYGDSDGRFTAEAILNWIRSNPPAIPELPGKLKRRARWIGCSRQCDKGGGASCTARRGRRKRFSSNTAPQNRRPRLKCQWSISAPRRPA